jgi:2'-5' RNA ligase
MNSFVVDEENNLGTYQPVEPIVQKMVEVSPITPDIGSESSKNKRMKAERSIQMTERLFIGVPLPETLAAEVAALYASNRVKGCSWVTVTNLHITLLFLGDTTASMKEMITNRLSTIQFHAFDVELQRHIQTFPPASQKQLRVLNIAVSDPSQIKYSQNLMNLKSEIDKTLYSIIDVNSPEGNEATEDGKLVEGENELPQEDEAIPMDVADAEIGEERSSDIKDTSPQPVSEQSKKTGKSRGSKSKIEVFLPHVTIARNKSCQIRDVRRWIEAANQSLSSRLNQSDNQVTGDVKETVEMKSTTNKWTFKVDHFILFRSTLTSNGSIYDTIQRFDAI